MLEREVIFADDLEKIFGKRPWESRSDELMRLNEELNGKKKLEAESSSEEKKEEKPEEFEIQEKPESENKVNF